MHEHDLFPKQAQTYTMLFLDFWSLSRFPDNPASAGTYATEMSRSSPHVSAIRRVIKIPFDDLFNNFIG
jgi:hypothetical protein